MYCSLRLFIDKTPDLNETKPIIQVFELFVNELGLSYDNITHLLLDPDNDNFIVDTKYLYTAKGISAFANSQITPITVGKLGGSSAPIISASDNTSNYKCYSGARVELQFPLNTIPLIIKVDYEHKPNRVMDLKKYSDIISEINKLGFNVNNAIFHKYRYKNEAFTLDCGHIGSLLTYGGRNSIKKSAAHYKRGCLNSIMDVYCANYLACGLVSAELKDAIISIVGNENSTVTSDGIAFALSDIEKLTPIYRIEYKKTIKKLSALFSKHGML